MIRLLIVDPLSLEFPRSCCPNASSTRDWFERFFASKGEIEYTIQRGDTLSGISMAFYGSTRYVDDILAANGGTLRSANSIRVGQVIRVPATPPGSPSQNDDGTGSVAAGE